MDKVLGSWRLKENVNFSNFLIFTQTSWFERRIALNCSIDVYIRCFLKNPSGYNHYNKKVKSMFYNTDENIILDFKPRMYGPIKKIYYLEDDRVNVDIKGTIVNWREQIYINNNNLVIKYIWNEGENIKTASQEFIKNE